MGNYNIEIYKDKDIFGIFLLIFVTGSDGRFA
jgi:hypothetical protein